MNNPALISESYSRLELADDLFKIAYVDGFDKAMKRLAGETASNGRGGVYELQRAVAYHDEGLKVVSWGKEMMPGGSDLDLIVGTSDLQHLILVQTKSGSIGRKSEKIGRWLSNADAFAEGLAPTVKVEIWGEVDLVAAPALQKVLDSFSPQRLSGPPTYRVAELR